MSVELNEVEAAALEGIRAISPEALALQKRYHKLAARIAPLKVEMDAIKDLLIEEMRSSGSTVLTHKGVPVVSMDATTSTSTDMKGLLAEFPGAVKYIIKKPSRRFNAKKPA